MPRISARALVALTALALLVLLPLLAERLGDTFYIAQARRIMIFALAAVSLDLILGFGGMVSLGHAAFFGVGAYTVGIMAFHARAGTMLLPGIPGTAELAVLLPLAMLVAGAVALAIGAISLRTTGVYFIMITLAFAQMLYFLFVSLKFYGGDDGLRFRMAKELMGLSLRNETTFYYVVLALLVLALYLGRRLVQSRFGMVLVGSRENERRMRAIGFPTFRYKLAAFALAGAVAGLAGALFAVHESYVSPSIMHWTRSGELIVMVVLGGMGTLIGPVIGAAAFLLMEKFLPDYTEHWMLLFGPALLIVAIAARRGLLGLFLREKHAS